LILRYLSVILAALGVAVLARPAWAGAPAPARLAQISRAVFGPRAVIAECIAHYESTDGAWMVNGPNLGPWQVNVEAHPGVDGARLLSNWWYAARVAYALSDGGRDWAAWATASECPVWLAGPVRADRHARLHRHRVRVARRPRVDRARRQAPARRLTKGETGGWFAAMRDAGSIRINRGLCSWSIEAPLAEGREVVTEYCKRGHPDLAAAAAAAPRAAAGPQASQMNA
jgi:hypothetical protein